MRLDAATGDGKRRAGAEQIAISHPLPPAANTRVTMVVSPPFAHLHYPTREWQSVFSATRRFVGNSVQNAHCRDNYTTPQA
jgi:hypothetical protein